MERIVIKENEWPRSKYKTKEWEDTVNIIRWEHDYEKKIYIIDFEKSEEKEV